MPALEVATLADGAQTADQVSARLVAFLEEAKESLDLALYDVRLPVGARCAGIDYGLSHCAERTEARVAVVLAAVSGIRERDREAELLRLPFRVGWPAVALKLSPVYERCLRVARGARSAPPPVHQTLGW